MALVRVCDFCGKHINKIDDSDYVNLEYYSSKANWMTVKTMESISICADCFNKYINNVLLHTEWKDPLSGDIVLKEKLDQMLAEEQKNNKKGKRK